MKRLSEAMVGSLPTSVGRPGYDRDSVAAGIVHLGIGAFHRAHQAVVTDAVLRAGDLRWGIQGVSLRSAGTRDALGPQNGLYAVNERGNEDCYRVVGAVQGVLVAPEDPGAVVDAMARSDVRIVSLTVTEKAYCLDPASGELDEGHPEVRHDVLHPEAPRSALGLVAAAVARRRAEGEAPFTVLCCDNLARNGATVGRALARMAGLMTPGLGAFVEDRVACPDTMVDRIVPATTEDDRARVAGVLGVHDAWPVVAEPFLQWVIEDRFPGGRPEWEGHGATMVADVAPFEAMKLRLLNGAHSAIAYLGLLAGAGTVAEAVRDGALARFVRGLMEDAAATVRLPAGVDMGAYREALMLRFANPALQHRTAQIAMDGSAKLPPRVLSVMRERLAAGLPVERHAVVVAAWMLHLARDREGGVADDPRAGEMDGLMRAGGAAALLDLQAVFGELGGDARVRGAVLGAMERLRSERLETVLAGSG